MRPRAFRPLFALVALTTAVAVSVPSAAAPRDVYREDPYGFQGEEGRIPDRDYRLGRIAPTDVQRQAAARLGGTVRWNEHGTPKVLIKHGGYLSPPRAGTAADVGRAWLRENAALFGVTPAAMAPERLALIADTPFYDAPDLRRMHERKPPLAKQVAHSLLFRQVFDGVAAGQDGLLHVGLSADGRVVWVSAMTTKDPRITNTRKLDALAAYVRAARNVDRPVALGALELVQAKDHAGFTTFRIKGGTGDLQRARLAAVPTPGQGVRLAWETIVLQAHPTKNSHPAAFNHFIDAETGAVLVRRNSLDHLGSGQGTHVSPQAVGDPTWSVFPANPPFPVPGEKTPDVRETWCWVMASDCDRFTGSDDDGLRQFATRSPYDVTYSPAGVPSTTFTTKGNNAETQASYVSHLTPDSPVSPASPTRQYNFPFTDQWHTSNCFAVANYASPARNDVDAATVNLFVMHNRMHDWGYFLGWTESTWNMQRHNFGEDDPNSDTARDQDPETGQPQAGGLAGGVAFLGRDNANQITVNDGVPGVTNQYLWHPLQSSFYSPCVDGAYDMSIVGHEVTHAISNRMTDGPDGDLFGHQSGAMGESWSDLAAVEYLQGYGFTPVAGEDPYAVGPFATGNQITGIRNYNMSRNPLNYSNLEYDGNGVTSPHADGEIWSGVQFDVRKGLIDKYQATHPYGDKELQYRCADGYEPAAGCPGNRRWIQIMFDAFLIQPGRTSMVDSRDAQLAADMMRFNGANQKELWAAYAARGLGNAADSGGPDDVEATPGWDSPVHTDEAKVRFQAVPVAGGGVPGTLEVYVGRYEARAVPVALSKKGAPSATVVMRPGTYEFLARGNGYGALRFTRTIKPGKPTDPAVTVPVPMRRNHASATHGAEVTGDGGNHQFVNDDTEATNWAYLGGETDTVEGKQFTVALAGGRQKVSEVQISAANRPALCDTATGDNPEEVFDCEDDDELPYDPNAQNRFAALRSFEILTCDATAGQDCDSDDGYKVVGVSAPDAFPTSRPRPLAPNLQLRAFDLPDVFATHVRLRVLSNQCTGNPLFSGAQNPVGDPMSNPDCVTGFTAAALTNTTATNPATIRNTQRFRVRVSELQVFSNITPPGTGTDPPGPLTPPVVRPRPGPGGPGIPATGADSSLLLAALVLATAGAAVAYGRRAAD